MYAHRTAVFAAVLALVTVATATAASVSHTARAEAPAPESVLQASARQRDAWQAASSALSACAADAAGQVTFGDCQLTRLDGHDPATLPPLPASHPLPLWRVRESGHELLLAGSTDALPSAAYPLPLALESAFHHADRLVLESQTTVTSVMDELKHSRKARLRYGQHLDEVVPGALLEILGPRIGADLPALQSARPAFAARVARRRAGELLGYRPALGLEHYLEARATAFGKPVATLGNSEDHNAALYDHDDDIQLDILRDALAPLPMLADELSAHTVAWLSGDGVPLPAAVADRERKRRNPEVLGARNQRLADAILDLMRSPQLELVVLDMAHLRGTAGVINLLRKAGLQVTQLDTGADLQPDLRAAAPAQVREDIVTRLQRARRLLDSYHGDRLQLEAAGAELRRVLELHPANYAAHLAMGRQALLMGMHSHGLTRHEQQQALTHLARALAIRPDAADVHLELAHTFIAGGQADPARQFLDAAVRLGDRSTTLLTLQGHLALLDQQLDRAQRDFQFVAGNPAHPQPDRYAALDGLIAVHMAHGNYEAVDAAYREQLRLEPRAVQAHAGYARFLLCMRRDHEQAADQARAALQLVDNAPARQTLGQALYARWAEAVMRGAVHDASNLYDDARRVLPSPIEAIDSAGNCAAMHRVRQAASVWRAPY